MSNRRMAAVWLMVAAAGVCCAPAAGQSFLNNITHNLRMEMSGVMEMANVSYSTPVINATYIARNEFDMRAMGMLYNSTHLVIDLIAKKQAYPEGVVHVSDGHLELPSVRKEWRPLLAHYAGPTAVIVVAVLFAVSLPLAGLFWCCCYWCRSGRRRRPFDRKYDACLKGLLAILLIALLTLFLFGVVCAFATEAQLEAGAARAAGALRAGLRDAHAFVNATHAHAHWLLVVNYGELERKMDALLTGAGMAVSVQLGEFSHAVSVTTLNKMVQQLDGVQADLRAVQHLTATLRFKAEQLNTGLRKVKLKLLTTLARCEMPPCINLQRKHRIGELNTDIQYSQMPDVSELLNNVTSLLDSRIKEEVADGYRVFRDIQRGIQRSVDEHIPSVHHAITDTGERLASLSERIRATAGEVSDMLQRHERASDRLQAAVAQYGPYRRYVGLGTASALLLITCVMAWGLMCGVCGKRPDVYGAGDCCNKGQGSKCLLCGMVIIFALGGVVTLVMLAYFVVGITAQRFVCDPLTEPRGSRLFADVERFVQLERAVYNESGGDFNLTALLTACHRNRTIFQTLQLHRAVNMSAWRAHAMQEVARRVAALRPQYPAARAPVTILRDSAKRKLRQLADTGLSDFDFDRILDALETNMTSLALDALAEQLSGTARAVSERAGYGNVTRELAAAAADLADLHHDIVLPMLNYTAALNTTAMKLRDELRFNHTSLKDAISYLIYETTQAELYLNTQGPDLMQNMTREFAEMVGAMLDGYLARVQHAADERLGRCGPLSAAFNATRDAACRNILMPTNGYWMSLAWCVVMVVPLLVVAQRLARLYLHVDPYPGPLVEAEYLYDAYADRDNVPLANAYKAEKRAGREGREGRDGRVRGRGEGEGGGGGARGAGPARPEAAALAPPLDAHHARRYNDMAPKHWEEGPPRYHGPTEYERPPPYYYPGPNDRQ
ncbi:prominin-like protein isoform X2 [Galleria mellonella]|uniref:Prominin-like protein isoform X2 n=1 Tax=Galleria mellonella TaxID=7137 RepID=A0ABM3MH75_GALME|nr:prominin-like protein isoform X2 [Galleria mellonella]